MAMEKVKLTDRQYMETEDYLTEREKLNREINSYTLVVDRECFRKDPKERDHELTLKESNKEERKKFYGKDANKHLNIPSRKLAHNIHMTF